MSQAPHDAPPSYYQAIANQQQPTIAGGSSDRLGVPQLQNKSRNGISPTARRSMEDEHRPLPEGWIRQLDRETEHQFFVDTRAQPPQSIWHHPYDDERYLESLSPAERQRVTGIHSHTNLSHADLMAESTDEEDNHDGGIHSSNKANIGGPLSINQQVPSQQPRKKETFGQKMKDKLTGTSHDQRESQRQQRSQQEQRAYEQHRAIRQAMIMAEQTGQPQMIGRDREGHDLYIEPSSGPGNINSGYPGYGVGRQQAYNPYAINPAYSNPNARFIRPQTAYSRPYGYGYGGGLGLPLAGGLLGGMMLGGMLGGF